MPAVPIRQWVLAFDPSLTTLVLRELIGAVSSWLRRRARGLGLRGMLKTGAVTVVQRFNSALDLSPHFHALVLDGVYTFPGGKKPVFHPTPSPRDEDVARVAAATFRRVERKMLAGPRRTSIPAIRIPSTSATTTMWCQSAAGKPGSPA